MGGCIAGGRWAKSVYCMTGKSSSCLIPISELRSRTTGWFYGMKALMLMFLLEVEQGYASQAI